MQFSNIIKKPIITEKSMRLTEENKYTFEVNLKSKKSTIAQEINKLFGVDVVKVKTGILPGTKRRIAKTFRFTKSPKRKKAVITLKEGQKIDFFPKE